MSKGIALVTALALVLHLIFGWMLVVLAAAAGGWYVKKRGWLVGGVGVLLAWLILVGYNFAVAPAQVSEMSRVMAEIVGRLPLVSTPLITIFIGFVLGVVGGSLGSSLSELSRQNQK